MSSGITILHYDLERKHYDLFKRQSENSLEPTQDKENAKSCSESNSYVIGDWVSIKYDAQWYPGEITGTLDEELQVKCMEVIGNGPSVKWPLHDDVHWYPKTDVLCRIQPPVPVSNRGLRLLQSDTESILMNLSE